MNDRNLTIAIVVAVIVVVGTLAYRAYFVEPESTEDISEEVAEVPLEETRRTAAWAKLTECNKADGKNLIEAKGYVENTGNVDLNYVTVKVIWSNRHGLVVEETEMYALNNEVLPPGAKKEFTDVTEHPRVTQCNVEPVDWW